MRTVRSNGEATAQASIQSAATPVLHEAPRPGELVEVGPGIYWTRVALPFRLNHVNVYAIDDGRAWNIVDTGICSQDAQETWDKLLVGPLAGRPFSKIIVTHHHPDHVGLASWLAQKLGAEVAMSGTEYLLGLTYWLDGEVMKADHYREFYRVRGLNPTTAESILDTAARYQELTSPLPFSFHRLIGGEELRLGSRRFRVITGAGHSPEQVMLHSPEDAILIGADQVMLGITPNVSVSPRNPRGDVLSLFLSSLSALADHVEPGATVLPGHNLPFTGLASRVVEIVQHHDSQLRAIVQACAGQPQSAADLLGVLFRRKLEGPIVELAFGEACAHVNRLLCIGELTTVVSSDGLERYVTP